MRTSEDQHQQAIERIRTTMDQLLRGHLPPGGRCDLKTLATQAHVNRTGFYPKHGQPGPYQHLAEEFDQRRTTLQATSGDPDPRQAQIIRLQSENTTHRQRITERDTTIEELTAFKIKALSRMAAQHDELQRLRTHASPGRALHALPPPHDNPPDPRHEPPS